MLVANKTPGTVYLSHGLDREVRAIKFRPAGDKDSVQELVDAVWAGSRNLNRLVNSGILTIEGAVELPSPPEAYSTLNKWSRNRVRAIVLGTDDEFETEGLMTPMGNVPGMPQRVDTQYIKKNLVPVIEVSIEWLTSLYTATKNKKYATRKRLLKEHAAALQELQ